MSGARFCPTCGALNPPEARFCERCGSRITASPAIQQRKKHTGRNIIIVIVAIFFILLIIGAIAEQTSTTNTTTTIVASSVVTSSDGSIAIPKQPSRAQFLAFNATLEQIFEQRPNVTMIQSTFEGVEHTNCPTIIGQVQAVQDEVEGNATMATPWQPAYQDYATYLGYVILSYRYQCDLQQDDQMYGPDSEQTIADQQGLEQAMSLTAQWYALTMQAIPAG